MGDATRREAIAVLHRHGLLSDDDVAYYARRAAEGRRPAPCVSVYGVAHRLADLESALGSLSRQVEARIADGVLWLPDHACADCAPNSELLVARFKCGRHAALAALAEKGGR